MKKLIFISLLSILTICGVSLSCNGKTTGPEQFVFSSPNLHCDDTVAVFSPASSCKSDTIPTVFLLHGYSDSWRIWPSKMDLQALADSSGFRIICPDGFYRSWYIDNADPTQMQWRKFFWKELWPKMSSEYVLTPSNTFITGLSMGGHGAVNIFLDRPDLFRGAGTMSGVVDLRHSGGSKESIAKMLGGKDIEAPVCQAQSAVNRLDRIKEVCGEEGAKDKIIVITCGYEDKTFYPASVNLDKACWEKGIRHITLMSPARHRWPYWTWVLRYHLDWFDQVWKDGELGWCK